MYAMIAFIPIIVTIIVMAVLNWPARRALPLAWLLTALIGWYFWGMAPVTIAAHTLSGFLTALDTLAIITGAVLLMNMLKYSGGMAVINHMFTTISDDPRIQLVIIGFMFSAFIEGAAGFGTSAALAAPLLISVGFPPLCAAMCALILNSSPVPFGAVGTPVITAWHMISGELAETADAELWKMEMTRWSASPSAVICPVILWMTMAMMCRLYGEEKSIRPAMACIPYIMAASLGFGLPSVFCAVFLGPEFPSLIGGLTGLVVTIGMARMGILTPGQPFRFRERVHWEAYWKAAVRQEEEGEEGESEEGKSAISPLRAWLPYGMIAAILVVTRLPVLGLKNRLNVSVLPFAVGWKEIFGVEVNWVFKWAWNPGILPFIPVALLIIPLFKMKKAAVQRALKATAVMVGSAAAALLFGIAMVQLFRNSGTAYNRSGMDSMLIIMANGMAALFGKAYIAVAPLIGVIGAFISGSATVSCTLFSSLQYAAAIQLGLPAVLISAMQILGAAMGNMVCVNNIVSVCATCGTGGVEGKLLRVNVLPCLVYAALTMVILGGLILLGYDPLPIG